MKNQEPKPIATEEAWYILISLNVDVALTPDGKIVALGVEYLEDEKGHFYAQSVAKIAYDLGKHAGEIAKTDQIREALGL